MRTGSKIMSENDKIIEAANRLGHYLQKSELVIRFKELSEKLEKDEDSKKLINEFIEASQVYHEKETKGEAIEAEDKRKMADLNEKVKANDLLNEFFATQSYYMALMQQVNEAIANPTGDPPKESTIITPDDDKKIIL